jgi:ATP-binding cassette, subfamily B, bacterial
LKSRPRSNYFLLLPYLHPQRVTIAQALCCTALFTVFWPILAILAGDMAKDIGAGNIQGIINLAGKGAVIFLLRGMVQYGQDTLMAKAALKIAMALRTQTYAHLHRLSLHYFEGAKTGDLSYRLTEDIDRVGEVINKIFHQFVPSILQLIVVLGYMFYINWQLTLAALVIGPLMAVLIGAFGEKLLDFSRRSQNQTSNLAALLTEVFNGIRLVQAFAAEDYELQRFTAEADQNRRAKFKAAQIKALQFVVVGFLEAMAIIFLFFLGGWQISQQNLTAADFVSYVAAVALLIDPIQITTSNFNEFKEGEASIDRIFELMAVQPTVLENPGAIALPSVTGKVEYQDVSFAYAADKPVLKGVNLTVQPGEMIALVGASGAGKTTLVNLLPRFYNPVAGKICIDGIDTSTITLKSLRQQIGIVPQETVLFSGTIAQNIAFGQTDFDLEQVEAAAKIANAHQFISEFSQGYHTYVGERGVNLSGGQRQRVAIARAVLLNPRILILDEATSALDAESEALVQEALERIMQDRTVFVIAHRLATVRRSDRIIVLEQGAIVEAGTHDELITLQGRYAQFHAQQFAE